MAKKKGSHSKMKPRVEEFDPAPIMPGPGVRAVDGDVSLDSERMVGGSKKTKKLTLEDDDEEETKEATGPDKFDPAIKRVLKSVSPNIKDAIKGTSCFGRYWFDGESYCEEVECDLRSMCESTYHQVVPREPEEDEVEEISEEDLKAAQKLLKKQKQKERGDLAKNTKKRSLKKKKKGPGRPKKKKRNNGAPRAPWEAEKYKTRTYVPTDRPVDVFAKVIWEELKKPPELTQNWRYGTSKTPRDRRHAKDSFIHKYGEHLMVIRRSGYHMYMYKGLHLFRMWVNAAGGGIVDMVPILAERVKKDHLNFEVYPAPAKNARHHFQFFTQRCFIGAEEQAIEFAAYVREIMPLLAVR